MHSWKKIFVRSAGFGFGAATALAIVVGLWILYSSRPVSPKPWNSQAIASKFSDLYVNTGDRIIAEFRYSLESSLDLDYTLPSDKDSAFVVLPEKKGLEKKTEMEWPSGMILPAHQRINIAFRIPYDYNDSYPRKQRDDLYKLNAFMNRRLKELDGFVMLDRKNRYEIKFSKGWETKEQNSNKGEQKE